MLAAAVPILERMLAGVKASEQMRKDLELRVAEKAREIEASHEQLRQVQREQALAEERRRIMADMHDGMGARLVALLSVAQSGKARHGEISEGIAAALDELRLTVDSVQPVEGDVGVVLGNVRHRMRSVFERAGVQLAWNVSELPRMDDLTPERILAIQRIVLETFSNAIRHAGARSVAVYTLRVPGAVRIVIEDDGRGFDTCRCKGRDRARQPAVARRAGGRHARRRIAGRQGHARHPDAAARGGGVARAPARFRAGGRRLPRSWDIARRGFVLALSRAAERGANQRGQGDAMTIGMHLNSRLLGAGVVLVLATAGCGLMAPKAERYVAPSLGTTWESMRHDTGSYGLGSGRVPGKRGERTWQGRQMVTFEAAGGTIFATAEGSWLGMFKGDTPLITWDPPLTWEPLEVGKSWTREQRMTIPAAKRTVSYTLTQKVESYGDVTVPAGTFKAFVLSTVTSLGEENLVWYSPAHGVFIKQSLKRTAKHSQGAGTREIEMLSYTAGK